MMAMQGCPGIVPETVAPIFAESFLSLEIKALSALENYPAPAPEAGALPGCATLRHSKKPYHIRFSLVNGFSRDLNKPEQSKHTGDSVPELYRSGLSAFARRSRAGCRA
jgi:hypothetical protein